MIDDFYRPKLSNSILQLIVSAEETLNHLGPVCQRLRKKSRLFENCLFPFRAFLSFDRKFELPHTVFKDFGNFSFFRVSVFLKNFPPLFKGDHKLSCVFFQILNTNLDILVAMAQLIVRLPG